MKSYFDSFQLKVFNYMQSQGKLLTKIDNFDSLARFSGSKMPIKSKLLIKCLSFKHCKTAGVSDSSCDASESTNQYFQYSSPKPCSDSINYSSISYEINMYRQELQVPQAPQGTHFQH